MAKAKTKNVVVNFEEEALVEYKSINKLEELKSSNKDGAHIKTQFSIYIEGIQNGEIPLPKDTKLLDNFCTVTKTKLTTGVDKDWKSYMEFKAERSARV